MLIGREPERGILGRLIAGARVGESGCVVITGEPGIGKTALLEDSLGLAHDMNLLRAAGNRVERDVGFAGLLQLLGPVLPHLADIPEPRARALEVALALREGAIDERFAVGAACLSLLSRYAEERPLLVMVDDAQDLDRPSTEALAFAVRRLVADPIAVVVATRPDPTSPLCATDVPQTELRGLSPADAEALFARLAAQPVSADLIQRLDPLTGGNPLALEELAGDVGRFARMSPMTPGPVPTRVGEVYGRRAAELSPVCRALLLLTVVAGGELGLVEPAAYRRGVDLTPLVEAERAGLLRLDDPRARLRHPLVAAGIYAAADPEDRRRAHLDIAEALPETAMERRAWHRAAAALGRDDAVAADLAVVAERTAQRGAHAVAATAWERSAELTTAIEAGQERRLAAAREAWLAGQQSRAADLLDTHAATSGGVGSPAVDWLRGTIALRAGSVAEARRLLGRAADSAGTTDPVRAVLVLSDLVESCFFLADIPSGLRAAERIEALLDVRGPAPGGELPGPVRVRGLLAAGIAQVIGGQPGIGAIRAAVEELQGRTAWWDDLHRPGWMVMGTLFLRESDSARELVRHAVAEVRARCALTTLPSLLCLTGRFDATSEQWEDAVTSYQEGIELARETGQTTDLAMLLAALASVLARCGPADACRRAAAEAVTLAGRHQVHIAAMWAAYASADLALGQGRTEEALRGFEELDRQARRRGLLDVDLAPVPEMVECLVALDRGTSAARAARSYLSRAEAKGQPWALARAHRAMALVVDPADSTEHFERALRLHEETPDVFERARTQLALGATLRRARQRVAARSPLQAASETFEALGAAPWAERASAELAATGAAAGRRTGGSRWAQLTPQELQIARLLGAGMTTKEAAAALFLSPKTVEYHLRHVYQRLQITSRAELARAQDPKPE